MKLEDLTLADAMITLFSGGGVVFVGWIFKKIFSKKLLPVELKINQSGNTVGGDMAGGSIHKDAKGSARTFVAKLVEQKDNKVDGDLAGENIHKPGK